MNPRHEIAGLVAACIITAAAVGIQQPEDRPRQEQGLPAQPAAGQETEVMTNLKETNVPTGHEEARAILRRMAASRDGQEGETLRKMAAAPSPGPGYQQAVHAIYLTDQVNPRITNRLINSPAFGPEGLRPGWTPVAQAVYASAAAGSDQWQEILNGRRLTVETRQTTTPMGRRITLNIVRTHAQKGSTAMRELTRAVRHAEKSMGVPFPDDYLTVLSATGLASSTQGVNYGALITLDEKLDRSPQAKGGHSRAEVLNHEVAHAYWMDNEVWLDEGIATLIAAEAVHGASRQGSEKRQEACPSPAPRISELRGKDSPDGCQYHAAEALFHDLLLQAGPARFRTGLQALYASGPSAGIKELKQAFPGAAFADTIDARY